MSPRKAKLLSKEVYSPSDDSWLLNEVIAREELAGKKCLDLGAGGGIQTEAMVRAGAKEVCAVDINPLALKSARARIKTLKLGHYKGAKCKIKFLRSDLFSKVHGKFDFIAFNPPYVPSEEIKWVDLDGGENGRETIDRFLAQFPKHLAKGGVVLLLLSSLNKPKEIFLMLKKSGFVASIVARKKLFFEELLVISAEKH